MDYFESAVYAKLFAKHVGTAEVHVDTALSPESEHAVQNKAIYNALLDKASLIEENTFFGKQTFNAETLFDAVIESNADVNITNHSVKISDSTNSKDIVAKYSADGITLEENNQEAKVLTFPKVSGTFITSNDFELKHSAIKNVDQNGDKEDSWSSNDIDASITIYHKNGSAYTGLAVSKDYAAMSYTGTDGTASVSISSNNVSIDSENTEGAHTIISLTPDSAKINNKNIITESGGTFEERPHVKTNGATSPIVIQDDLQNYVQSQSQSDSIYYSLVDNANGIFSVHMTRTADDVNLSSISTTENGVTIDGINIKNDLATKAYVDSKIPSSIIDAEMSDESENAIQNKAVSAALKDCVKCQPTTNNQLKAYCTSPNSTSDVCAVSNNGIGNSIARYTANGHLIDQADPDQGNQLCNKTYVDGKTVRYGNGLPTSGLGTVYKVGCTYVDTATGGHYILTQSGSSYSWQHQITFDKPAWKPMSPQDTTKVIATKIKIVTTDNINFPGMNGKEISMAGYQNNGFSGTIVCSDDTTDHNFAFIGTISTEYASGIFLKANTAITKVTTANPDISFSYEYLW